MSVWAYLYAYRDQETIAQNVRDAREYRAESDGSVLHWESPYFSTLWAELGGVPRPQREEFGIAGLVDCVGDGDLFHDMLCDGGVSTEDWCSIDGIADCVDRLILLIEENPSPLETSLRRTIVSCTLRPGPTEEKEKDAAWPAVADQRSVYVAAFAEELRELAATLRRLQAQGETHIALTID